MENPVLYDYRPYDYPRFGTFKITGDKYGPHGWEIKLKGFKIIGEIKDAYVTNLLPSGHDEWIADKIIRHEYILPIGIHKSRLIAWTSGQLSLF